MFSYAQNYEDVYIYRAFREVVDGFYVDVGAYDPTDDSVTKFFYDLGWTGINVEPGPIFDKLRQERQNDINLRLAVADRVGDIDFYVHEGEPGTSTLVESLDPQLMARVPVRHKLRVPVTTLAKLIETHAPDKHIHFLKLDVEGAEEAIIKSTDWRRYRPELLVVEATVPYSHERRDEAWNETLRAAGYSLVFFDGINTYYLREESLHRKAAFGLPVNVLDYAKKYDYETEHRVSDLERALAGATARLNKSEFERSKLLLQLQRSAADYSRFASERATLVRDLQMPGAPKSLALALAIAKPLRSVARVAFASYRALRTRGVLLLRKLAGTVLSKLRPKDKPPLPTAVEEALLTLELLTGGGASAPRALFDQRRRTARLARTAETELRALALHHAKPRRRAGDQA